VFPEDSDPDAVTSAGQVAVAVAAAQLVVAVFDAAVEAEAVPAVVAVAGNCPVAVAVPAGAAPVAVFPVEVSPGKPVAVVRTVSVAVHLSGSVRDSLRYFVSYVSSRSTLLR